MCYTAIWTELRHLITGSTQMLALHHCLMCDTTASVLHNRLYYLLINCLFRVIRCRCRIPDGCVVQVIRRWCRAGIRWWCIWDGSIARQKACTCTIPSSENLHYIMTSCTRVTTDRKTCITQPSALNRHLYDLHLFTKDTKMPKCPVWYCLKPYLTLSWPPMP